MHIAASPLYGTSRKRRQPSFSGKFDHRKPKNADVRPREYRDSPYVFVTERRGTLADSAVRKIVTSAGETAGFEFPIHPYMLRHATGYKLANDGHDTRAIQQYLSHKNIQDAVRYTQLNAAWFRNIWED